MVTLGLSLMAAGASLIPYLLASRLAGDGKVFAGFLLNPTDGFSYLAKMRQGAAGSWMFHLPYAADPGEGAFLFTHYLLLGHLSRWLGLPLLSLLHAARLAGSVAMDLAAFWLFSRVLTEPKARWLAYGWTLVGSGLGWMALPLGRIAADLWVPELIPSLSALVSAHFPLAAAAYVAALVSLLPGGPVRQRTALAAVCGLLLSVLQPFSVVALLAVAGAWLFWEAVHALGRRRQGPAFRPGTSLAPLAAFSLAALPQMAYDLWAFRVVPALKVWSAQNQTPSPPVIDYAFGLGLVGLMAVAGAASGRVRASPEGRLLVAWAVVQASLLYAPVGVQRRLALGWSFALASLAMLALELWLRSGRARAVGFALLIGLSLPTNLLVISAALRAVAAGDPALVLAEGEIAGYRWLAENARGRPLVLAAPETGTRLPAYAEVRVLYGHPFETPLAAEQRSLVEALFRSDQDPAQGLRAVRDLNVKLIFYGPREQELGRPAWLGMLDPVHAGEGVSIYEVPDQ